MLRREFFRNVSAAGFGFNLARLHSSLAPTPRTLLTGIPPVDARLGVGIPYDQTLLVYGPGSKAFFDCWFPGYADTHAIWADLGRIHETLQKHPERHYNLIAIVGLWLEFTELPRAAIVLRVDHDPRTSGDPDIHRWLVTQCHPYVGSAHPPMCRFQTRTRMVGPPHHRRTEHSLYLPQQVCE